MQIPAGVHAAKIAGSLPDSPNAKIISENTYKTKPDITPPIIKIPVPFLLYDNLRENVAAISTIEKRKRGIASNVDLGGDTYSNLTVATTNWDNDRTHTSDLIQEHEDAGGNSGEEGELQNQLYPKFPLPDGYTVNSQVQDNPFTTNSLNVNSYMKTFFDRQKYTYDNISTYTADDFNELGDPYYDFQFEFSSITTQFNDESSNLITHR